MEDLCHFLFIAKKPAFNHSLYEWCTFPMLIIESLLKVFHEFAHIPWKKWPIQLMYMRLMYLTLPWRPNDAQYSRYLQLKDTTT